MAFPRPCDKVSSVTSSLDSWRHCPDAYSRQAQELGLHRQSVMRQAVGRSKEETLSMLWYDEYKRRLWMNLFIWDGYVKLDRIST